MMIVRSTVTRLKGHFPNIVRTGLGSFRTRPWHRGPLLAFSQRRSLQQRQRQRQTITLLSILTESSEHSEISFA